MGWLKGLIDLEELQFGPPKDLIPNELNFTPISLFHPSLIWWKKQDQQKAKGELGIFSGGSNALMEDLPTWNSPMNHKHSRAVFGGS